MSGRKTAKSNKPRTRLATYGPKGRTVKVFKETGWLVVRVQWSNALGLTETKSWPNTRDGIKEAKAWAKAFSDAREQPAYVQPTHMTLRGLWEAYVTAEFPALRKKTKRNYTLHWHTWELFAGRALEADLVTPEMLDNLREDLSSRTNAKGEAAPVAISQQRQVVSTVKRVFAWGIQRGHVARERILLYRFKVAKEQRSQLVPEYSNAEHAAIVAQLDPRKASQWRAWALVVLTGEVGPRINAALHLTWDDITLPYEPVVSASNPDDVFFGSIRWASEFDKLGNVRVQAITQAVRDALFVALGWSRANPKATGASTEWVFYAARQDNGRKKTKRDGTETSGEYVTDGTYSVQGAWWALRQAEERAGVTHIPRRAFHGKRRMAAGNALEETNNPVTAMQWIGDTDLKQAKKYLKEREAPMREVAQKLTRRGAAAAAPVAQTPPESPLSNRNATATAPESTTAPDFAGAVSGDSTTSYDK